MAFLARLATIRASTETKPSSTVYECTLCHCTFDEEHAFCPECRGNRLVEI